MQQDKYIFHLYVFCTCFGQDITHHQELQYCTNSDMVIVPREVRRDVVEEIKSPRRHLFGLVWELLPYLNLYSSVTPDDG